MSDDLLWIILIAGMAATYIGWGFAEYAEESDGVLSRIGQVLLLAGILGCLATILVLLAHGVTKALEDFPILTGGFG